jgi:group I intron endonuclease
VYSGVSSLVSEITMKSQVIYKIINQVNDKFYVGSTINTRERFRTHRKKLRSNTHHCHHLQAAWNKYGEGKFVFQVIETVPEGQSLFEAENRWLHEHVGKPYCYNIGRSAEAPMRGRVGELHPQFGVPVSAEQKEAISKTLKDFYAEDPNNHPMRGKKQSAESVAKANATRKANGKAAGQNHYRYGKTVSEEVRAKISATQKGKPNPRKGKKMSEQGRLNVIASLKRGVDSPLYGKPPVNIEQLQKPVVAVLPDRTTQEFPSLTYVRDNLGLSIATTIRACKSGNPIKFGTCAGWVFSYKDTPNTAPHIPEEFLPYPRSRQEAKTTGAKFYFTGVPCSRGHVALRLTKGACEICRREDWSKKPLDTSPQAC